MTVPCLTALLTAACLLGLTVTTRAQSDPSGQTYGRHFIVLIDDSGSIAGRTRGSSDRRKEIREDLPGQLFGDIKGIRSFDPSRDRVSVLFFTILDTPKPCGDKREPRSPLPENIFDLVYTGRLQGKEEFSDKLSKWMSDESCHFNGNWSPIVASTLLVLPYLQDKLPADELHEQTILIQVTDGEFNSKAKPGHEMTDYRRVGLKDVPAADQQLSQVSRLFTLNILPNQDPLRGVFYLVAVYGSQRPPESAIQYQRNSLLYPQALSPRELRYRLNDQTLGDIQLLSQGTGAEYDFKPLWMRVGFEDERGGDWRVGGVPLPRLSEETAPVSLSPCQSPQCEAGKDNDRLGIGLFETGLGAPLKVPPSAPDPESGRIRFRVGFHYDTPIYKHLSVETPELSIKVAPSQPAEIPNLLYAPTRLSKADIAAEWSEDGDRITTQEEAKNRSLARRDVRSLLLFGALVCLVVLSMIFLFLRYHDRRFRPQLDWLAAPEVLVDLNRPAASPQLVGTLKVENNQPVPWFGRLINNEAQPMREAEISLKYNFFQQSGLDVAGENPIGFIHVERDDAPLDALNHKTLEAVCDGRQVHVFLAAENIRDYQTDRGTSVLKGEPGCDARFDIPLKAEISWHPVELTDARQGVKRWLRRLKALLAAERPGSSNKEIGCSLTVKPEEPRPPHVTYTPSAEPRLYFQKDTPVRVGSFRFESGALHQFAQPWQEKYAIQTYQGQRPLGGEQLRLAQSEIVVPPGKSVEVPVHIYCDGQAVTNPETSSREYTFRLIGDFVNDSAKDFHRATLHRDPTRADIELRLIRSPREFEVYWSDEGTLKVRTLPEGASADELLGEDAIYLEPQAVRFDATTTTTRELLKFEIGNTGVVGEGTVEVALHTTILCDRAVHNDIQLIDNFVLDDLLGIYDFNQPSPYVKIGEGQPAEVRALRLRPGLIARIDSAQIEAERLAAEVRLEVRVVNDQQEVTLRTLLVRIPFSLEQLPGQNWLAIDFGTSAISAAIGSGDREAVRMVPLQTISKGEGLSFAKYDIDNPERHNPYLLPSWVCCSADLRAPSGDRSRPGFPGYYSPDLSMEPGEPDFIGLPAVTHDIEEHPGRIIYSLKSWLGKASPYIPIHVKENGHSALRVYPLEKMVESGFAALAEAYLFAPEDRAQQVVITHPNTFTQRHRDLLLRNVYAALSKKARLGIPLRSRIRLISESDAVAYYYCNEQMYEQPRAGTERILVYDFGAGTLDLSLIRVEWKLDAPYYPTGWKVERRLGVPVAGNYFDEILARLLHDLLSDPSIVNDKGFRYRRKVVGLHLDRDDEQDHRQAVVNLWRWLREGKHRWSDACRGILDNGGRLRDCPPLRVRVGGGDLGVVTYSVRPEVEELVGEPSLYVEEYGDIYLSIPARLIVENERLSQFVEFVTVDVLEEMLDGAGVRAEEVNTVIVSGRGARFPGLREKIWGRFQNATTPDLLGNDTMKSAVVLGAIARQDLSLNFADDNETAASAPQLAILTKNHHLILEQDWDKPINLTASPTFRLVQVNLRNPDPRKDLRSLREHFYIDLSDREFVRDDFLGEDKRLYVHKETNNVGELVIYLSGANGGPPAPVFPEDQTAKNVTNPPWPIGNVLLDPRK